MTSPEKAALFVGPLKPTCSRLAVSRVWARAPRPGPANYTLQGSLGTCVGARGVRGVSSRAAHGARCRARRTAHGSTRPPPFRRQSVSAHPSTTGFAFGKESREGYNTNPSPSDQFLFTAEVSLGTQVTSKRVTSPRAHMGTGTRDAASVSYNVHTYKPH